MPYMVVDGGVEGVDKRWCVFKHDANHKPIGKPLGCHPTEAAAQQQMAAIYANEGAPKSIAVRGIDWISVKAVPGKDWHLRVLGVPFNGPYNGKDKMGEYFSAKTDIMMAIGDWRPVIYYHGMKPGGSETAVPEVIGRAQLLGKTAKGWEFDVWLDQTKVLAKRVWDAALKGLAKASSGAVAHLVRTLKKTGEILTWPLGELSLLDVGDGREPANPWATVTPMRAVFDQAEIELPESLAEGDEPKADEVQPEPKPVEQAAVVAEPEKAIVPDVAPAAVVAAVVAALKARSN